MSPGDFLLLDEPTAGMEARERRAAWELIKKAKTGKVVILTT